MLTPEMGMDQLHDSHLTRETWGLPRAASQAQTRRKLLGASGILSTSYENWMGSKSRALGSPMELLSGSDLFHPGSPEHLAITCQVDCLPPRLPLLCSSSLMPFPPGPLYWTRKRMEDSSSVSVVWGEPFQSLPQGVGCSPLAQASSGDQCRQLREQMAKRLMGD